MRLSDAWAYHYDGEHYCLKCIGRVIDSMTTEGEVATGLALFQGG